MERVVNIGIPHVGEHILEHISIEELIQCLSVSQTWKILAENVLLKKCRGKIFEACKKGHADIVKILLERSDIDCSKLNDRDIKERTALMYACGRGHTNVVKLLLQTTENPNSDRRIDFNAKSNISRTTSLMYACRNGRTDVVKLLVNHSKINIELNVFSVYGINMDFCYGWTAFMMACRHGHKDVVEFLINQTEKRVDLNAGVVGYGWTAFMLACQQGHKDVVKLMLDHSDRIELNAIAKGNRSKGQTAYIEACKHGHKDVVKLLLEHPDINTEVKHGTLITKCYCFDQFCEWHQKKT